MKINIRKIIFTVIGIFLIYFLYTLYNAVSKIDIAEHLNYSTTFKPNYTVQFLNSHDVKRLDGVYLSKSRNPIAIYQIDTSYSLLIYEINLPKDESIKKMILKKTDEIELTKEIVYNDISSGYFFTTNIKSGKPSVVNKLYLTSEEFLKEIAISDSLAYYSTNTKGFSLQYLINEPKDIVIKTQSFWDKKKPLSILFLKREKSLYLFLLFQNHKNQDSFDKMKLYNLIARKK